MTWSRNSWLEQVHRANLQKIASYPVTFPRDLFFFSFFCSLPFFFFSFSFSLLKLKIYILVHIWLCGRLSDKKIFIWLISKNKTSFFFLALPNFLLVYFVFSNQGVKNNTNLCAADWTPYCSSLVYICYCSAGSIWAGTQSTYPALVSSSNSVPQLPVSRLHYHCHYLSASLALSC